MTLSNAHKLRKKGVLALEARNSKYIASYNRRALWPLADDKYKTKQRAYQHGVPVPELYGLIQHPRELNTLEALWRSHDAFVVKPSQGRSGNGVLIIAGRSEADFVAANGAVLSLIDLKRHCCKVLRGHYSLYRKPDKVLIEQVVQPAQPLRDYACQGIPDVRVIVFRGFPVMAMMRLPTRVSDGKSNLHLGAVGVGLELQTGRARHAILCEQPVERHPDTGLVLKELIVPRWEEVLRLAAKSYEMTRLGFIGADIVLDEECGPLLLELNVRPGLAIQLANGMGLMKRLNYFSSLGERAERMSFKERVACALAFVGEEGR